MNTHTGIKHIYLHENNCMLEYLAPHYNIITLPIIPKRFTKKCKQHRHTLKREYKFQFISQQAKEDEFIKYKLITVIHLKRNELVYYTFPIDLSLGRIHQHWLAAIEFTIDTKMLYKMRKMKYIPVYKMYEDLKKTKVNKFTKT